MIYLIESAAYKEENGNKVYFSLLKIGYTEDKQKVIRFSQYKLHNPTCKVLFEIPEATEDHEKKVQYKFKDLLFEGYGREWFKYDQSIIDFFQNIKSLDELEKLPKNPVRGNQLVLLGKRETRKILSYLFDTKEEIEEYLDKISKDLGDTISYYTSIEYIKGDPSIDKDKLEKYFEIAKSKATGIYCEDTIINQEVSEFMNIYNSYNTRFEKLRFLCESNMSKEAIEIILGQIADSDEIKSYYLALGPQKLRALSYDITRIRKALGIVVFSQELLISEIYSNFREGDKYTLSNLKEKLRDIYSSINYQSTPKASDICNWFESKLIYLTVISDNGKKKQTKGYELLKSKEQELREELKNIN